MRSEGGKTREAETDEDGEGRGGYFGFRARKCVFNFPLLLRREQQLFMILEIDTGNSRGFKKGNHEKRASVKEKHINKSNKSNKNQVWKNFQGIFLCNRFFYKLFFCGGVYFQQLN